MKVIKEEISKIWTLPKLDSWGGSVFYVQPLEKSIKQLPNHLKKVEDWLQTISNLNHSILTSYEKVMVFGIWEKLERKFYMRFNFFFFKMNWRELEYLKGRERKEQTGQWEEATSLQGRVGHVCHTGVEACPGHVAHDLHTWWPKHGLWPCTSLSHTAHVLRLYSGLQTPILNPFSDHKSWLPHTQRWLWNFDKKLRNHLWIRWWKQLNEWERKVA